MENVTWHDRIFRGKGDPTGPADVIGAPRRFSRGDHDDHVHVSFTMEASQREPPALLVYLKEVAFEIGSSAANP